MKVIKIDSKPLLNTVILIALCSIVWLAFLAYNIFYLSDYSIFEGRVDYAVAVIGTPFVLLGLCFIPFIERETYLSEMVLYDDKIELIYKKRYKIEYKKTIYKNEISEFFVLARFIKNEDTTQNTCKCASGVTIKLRNGETIKFNQMSHRLDDNFLIDILKVQQKIPGFKYKIEGGNEFEIAYINYFIRFGKKPPLNFWFSYFWKSTSKYPIIAYIVCIITLTICMILLY